MNITIKPTTQPADRRGLVTALADLLLDLSKPGAPNVVARCRQLLPGSLMLVRMLAARGDEDGRCLARLLCLPRPVDVAAVRAALINAA